MKRFGFIGAISFFFCFGIETARAHDCDHHGHDYHDDCWNCSRSYTQSMDRQPMNLSSPSGVVDQRALEGRIGEIVYLPGPTPESGMVEIRLLSGSQTTLVRIAPSGYLRQHGMILREGEALTVKGFIVAGMEGNLIVATEIHQGDKGLTLRDGRGRSAW